MVDGEGVVGGFWEMERIWLIGWIYSIHREMRSNENKRNKCLVGINPLCRIDEDGYHRSFRTYKILAGLPK